MLFFKCSNASAFNWQKIIIIRYIRSMWQLWRFIFIILHRNTRCYVQSEKQKQMPMMQTAFDLFINRTFYTWRQAAGTTSVEIVLLKWEAEYFQQTMPEGSFRDYFMNMHQQNERYAASDRSLLLGRAAAMSRFSYSQCKSVFRWNMCKSDVILWDLQEQKLQY